MNHFPIASHKTRFVQTIPGLFANENSPCFCKALRVNIKLWSDAFKIAKGLIDLRIIIALSYDVLQL